MQQRNGMSFMIKIQIMVKEMKMAHMIIQMHILSILLHYITATNGNEIANVEFKNFVPFTKCITHINDEHMDEVKNLDITMSLYKLIEYSDNYSDTSGSLLQF